MGAEKKPRIGVYHYRSKPISFDLHNSDPREAYLKRAKRQLGRFMLEERYAEARQLLRALIATNRYSPKDYWEIAVQLTEKLQPERLETVFERAMASVPVSVQRPVMHAWMKHLMEKEKYEKVVDEITLRQAKAVYANDEFLADILKLATQKQDALLEKKSLPKEQSDNNDGT